MCHPIFNLSQRETHLFRMAGLCPLYCKCHRFLVFSCTNVCQIGSTIIALNGEHYTERVPYILISCAQGPQEQTPGEILAFQKLFLAPGFLAYISALITIALSIIFYFGPKSVTFNMLSFPFIYPFLFRYGKNNMLWYISVCSTIGGISVSVTTGLGAAIVMSVMGVNQASCCNYHNVALFHGTTVQALVYILFNGFRGDYTMCVINISSFRCTNARQ